MVKRDDLVKFGLATNNEIFDTEYKGGEWMKNISETHETLEQWVDSSKEWQMRTNAKFGEVAGFKFVSFENSQLRKGTERTSISIVDFGNLRVVLYGTFLPTFL